VTTEPPKGINPQFGELIGQSAAVAYRAILLRYPDVRECTVFHYQSPPLLQQRIVMTPFEEAIVRDALQIRANTKIPFWEAIFSACVLKAECSEALLSATFYHHGQGIAEGYSRDAIERNILERVAEDDAVNVALGSKVICEGDRELHLGLLDFHCDISASNTEIVYRVCRYLLPRGFMVLDSGDSYHAAGLNLMSAEERVRLLGRALMASPIVDVPYIGHQLQQDSSSIRISRGGKAKQVPTVLRVGLP
jgi:hypothetical protein